MAGEPHSTRWPAPACRTVLREPGADLFEATTDVVVNPVNAVGVMGSGLARRFRKCYPGLFRAYKEACATGHLVAGGAWTHQTGALFGPRFVVCVATKDHWRQPSRMSDIEAGVAALARETTRLGASSVAVPALGCGQGGLSWERVRPVIANGLGALDGVRAVLFPPAPLSPPAPR